MVSKRLNVLLIALVVFSEECVAKISWTPITREFKTLLGYPRDSLLNFTELTAAYGYSSEEHKVVTEDGYILTVFRVSKAKKCVHKKKSPPVLLMHGFLQSSDSWIDSGPSFGLAYLISDACYDLWIGNDRGNYYSRGHIRLNPDDNAEYWNFYVDDIGRYDHPAVIDYILDYTDNDKMNYIGFSQGCMTFFVMCSERPGYCEKVQLFIGLAPSSRQTNTNSEILTGLSQAFEQMERALSKHFIHEILPKGAFGQEFVAFFCQFSDLTTNLCRAFIDLINYRVQSFNSGSIAKNTTRVLFGHFPAGASLHTIAWYGQSQKGSKFQKFNYGKKKNVVVYGSEEPPEYNLRAVTVPVVLIYGKDDGYVNIKDVKWLISKLPNVIELVKFADPWWNHLNVPYGQHTADFIYPKIKEYLFKYTHG